MGRAGEARAVRGRILASECFTMNVAAVDGGLRCFVKTEEMNLGELDVGCS